jgi:hypothetical protein
LDINAAVTSRHQALYARRPPAARWSMAFGLILRRGPGDLGEQWHCASSRSYRDLQGRIELDSLLG